MSHCGVEGAMLCFYQHMPQDKVQWNKFIFINILCQHPLGHSEWDELVLCYICRATSMPWGVGRETVWSTAQLYINSWDNQIPGFGVLLNIAPTGLWCCHMLMDSLQPVKYANYQQFKIISKLRAGYHNVYISLVEGATSLRSIGGDKTRSFLDLCSINSSWLEHFAVRCLCCMGGLAGLFAVSLPLMHTLINIFT